VPEPGPSSTASPLPAGPLKAQLVAKYNQRKALAAALEALALAGLPAGTPAAASLEAGLAVLDGEISTMRQQGDRDLPLAVKCHRAVRDRDQALPKTRATADEMARTETLLNKLLCRQQELVERMAVQQHKADELARRASELSVALAQSGLPVPAAAVVTGSTPSGLPAPSTAPAPAPPGTEPGPDAKMLTEQETAEAEAVPRQAGPGVASRGSPRQGPR
jgi:hypothetical protein